MKNRAYIFFLFSFFFLQILKEEKKSSWANSALAVRARIKLGSQTV